MQPNERAPLIIELKGTWPTFQRCYRTPTFGEVLPPAAVRLDALGADYTVAGATGLEAIQAVLARGTRDELTAHLSGARLDQVGAILFEALLGDETTWGPVLRRVFGVPVPLRQPHPDRGPVRVLLRTRDARLQGLPWRAVMWESNPLADAGWTFEVDLDEEGAETVELRAPGSILVIAPDYPGMPYIATGAHLAALADAFEGLSPGRGTSPHFEIARTGAEVQARLAGMAPDIVYYYGHGDAAGQQLRLLLGGPGGREEVLMRDFAGWLPARPPRVAFFNGCQTGQAGWHSAGFLLVKKKVPVVVTNVTTAWSEAAGSFAVHWFKKWLGEGLDPIVTLHARETRASSASFDWITPIVHTSCPAWTTHRPRHGIAGALPGAPEDWLDRNEQRARGSYDILELVDDPRRRVMAAATCAPPGNHLDRIAHQIINRIERHSGTRVHVKHVSLKFPQQRGLATLADNLEHGFKTQLGHRPAVPLAQVLEGYARRCPPGVVAVLWADWGVFGDGPDCQPRLSKDELRAFIAFARDRLAAACREDRLRLVTSVAMDRAAERIDALHQTLQGFAGEPMFRTPAFVFKVIPPLKDVELVEIVEYLEQAGCDDGARQTLAPAIFAKTRGRYSETVEVLKRGHASSWYNLLAEIGQPEGKALDDGFG